MKHLLKFVGLFIIFHGKKTCSICKSDKTIPKCLWQKPWHTPSLCWPTEVNSQKFQMVYLHTQVPFRKKVVVAKSPIVYLPEIYQIPVSNQTSCHSPVPNQGQDLQVQSSTFTIRLQSFHMFHNKITAIMLCTMLISKTFIEDLHYWCISNAA